MKLDKQYEKYSNIFHERNIVYLRNFGTYIKNLLKINLTVFNTDYIDNTNLATCARKRKVPGSSPAATDV